MIIPPTDDPKVDAQREDLLDHFPGKALAQKACHILCPRTSFRPVMGQVGSNICGFLRGASQKNSVQETEPRVGCQLRVLKRMGLQRILDGGSVV